MRSMTMGALALIFMGAAAQAADLPKRKSAVEAPEAQTYCLDAKELPADAFGFAAGSDVASLGSLGGGLEYSGAFGARVGSAQAHGAKLSLSFSPIRCLEVGPSVTGAWARSSADGATTRSSAYGAGVELKYKALGRQTHGFGLTIGVEPTAAFGRVRFSDPGAGVFQRGSGSAYGATFKILADKELVADRLFGALNVEHAAGWTKDDGAACSTASGSGYCRGSQLNLRAALAWKATDDLFVGADVSHQRAYDGIALNRSPGWAWFAGPNLFWKASEAVTLNAAWSTQLSGRAPGQSGGGLNLDQFSRHIVKAKIGVSF